jgi:hypothetical protein
MNGCLHYENKFIETLNMHLEFSLSLRAEVPMNSKFTTGTRKWS